MSAGYAASDGAAYERFLGRFTHDLAAALTAFAGPPGNGPLLDVGCGTGNLAMALARAWPGREVVGVDIASSYLAFAAARAPALRFGRADATALPFADGSFAAALSQLVLNFVGDPEAAMAEMRRVTRPGGTVAAAVWDFGGGLVYQRLLWDSVAGIEPAAAAARDRLFRHPLAQPGGLADLLHRHGLEDIAEASLTIRMGFADFADYWEPLLGGQGPFGGFVAGLSPERRGRIRALVRAAYLAGGEDGPRSMTATAWAARGRVA